MKRKTTQAVKITPNIIKGKEATLVSGTVKLLHQKWVEQRAHVYTPHIRSSVHIAREKAARC